MDIIGIIIVIIIIVLSMTLHEAMHAFVSYWLGDDTAKLEGRLTLNPIRHIDPFLTLFLPVMLAIIGGPIFGGAKPVPFNPDRVRYGDWGAALVAIAGPLTNFLIAFIAFGVYAIAGISNNEMIISLAMAVVTVNLGFFVFNMIPIPPLDGSRVLYALAPEFVRRGMEAIEKYGIVVMLIIVVVASSLVSQIMMSIMDLIIGLFTRIFGM
jgi:Zn-dependent protease